MTPYIYPKTKHVRSETPPEFRQYTRYKSYLRKEFSSKCVYCCNPDQGRPELYHVDHYRPKIQFPELMCAYSNLFYACPSCNQRKGRYWSPPSEQPGSRFIPNPCDTKMFNHVRFIKDFVVEHRSEAGKFMIDKLQLNDSAAIRFREGLYLAIQGLLMMLGDKRALREEILKDRQHHGPKKVQAAIDLINREEQDLRRTLFDYGITVDA